MSITYTVNAALRLVEVRMTGPVTMEDYLAYVTALHADPAVDTDFRLLGDIQGIQAHFTSRELMRFQEWRKRYPPYRETAVVAATDYEFGMARMFEMATGSAGASQFRVFRDMAAARAWLKLPDA